MTFVPRKACLPRRPSIILAAAVATALAACGGGDAGGTGGEGVAVDTVAGVERTLWPRAGGEVLYRGVDTVATIGAAFGGEGLVLASVPGGRTGLAADGRGTLWVLDAGERRIHRFDSAGTRTASWGRRGEGPGELEAPGGLTAGPGDSVWVYDWRLDRLTVFADRGGGFRTLSPSAEGALLSAALAPLLGGFHLQQARSRPSLMGGPQDRTMMVLRFAPDGSVTDTTAAMEQPPEKQVQMGSSEEGAVRFTLLEPEFAPELSWALLPGARVAVSDTAAYRIRVVDDSGREIRRFGRRGEPRPVTGADREAARARRFEDTDSATARRLVEAMTFADVVPRIQALAAAPDGRLWVRTAPGEAGGESGIDVFDAGGRLLGRAVDVPWPHAFVAPRLVARVVRDELDVSRVQLLRLRPAGD